MVSYHRGRLRATTVYIRAIAVAIAVQITAPAPVLAQLSNAFRTSPKGQRLTPQALADLELTQIAPDYRLHREWMTCLNEAARVSLVNDRSVEATAALVFNICDGGEGPLQASLARAIGLPRARAVIATLRENKLAEIKLLYQKLHARAPGVLSTIRGWDVMRSTDGCMAVYRSQGILSPETVLIQRKAAGFSLIMHVSGSAAHATAQTGSTRNLIVLWKGSSATQYGEQTFEPVPVADGAAVTTALGPKLLAALDGFDRFQRGSEQIFPITGIAEVTAALDRCFGQQ